MSEGPQGPGWWQASDLKWYPGAQNPDYTASLPPPRQGGFDPQATYGPRALPNNRLGLAIVTTVVTFFFGYLGAIPGIVSIIHAAKVNRLWTMQLYDDACQAAKTAKTWITVAWAVAAIEVVAFVLLVVALPSSPMHRAIFDASRSGSTGSGGSSESSGGSGNSLAPGKARISIDGSVQDLTGPVKCDDMGVGEQIYIGGDGGTLIQMLQTDPPKVDNLNFGAFTSYDGVTGLAAGFMNDSTNVTASKDGNSWKFAGTAAGQKDNSSQFVTRTFEIDLTCP